MIGTGETHSVRELCETAFGHVGLDWRKHVVSDPDVHPSGRGGPAAGGSGQGDAASSAGRPKVTFEQLVEMMVDADLARLAPLKA